MLDSVLTYVSTGGFVMPVLLACGVALWTALGLRFQLLRRTPRGSPHVHCTAALDEPASSSPAAGLVEAFVREAAKAVRGSSVEHSRRRLDAVTGEAEMELVRFRSFIRSLCGAAPLLGLLGTVTGMIETFSSLTTMELFAQSGGVAGGISEALVSTQMGLFVAIPGVIAGRFLDTREESLRSEMERARELLVRLAQGEVTR